MVIESESIKQSIQTYAAHPLALTQSACVKNPSVLKLSHEELFAQAKHPEAAWSGLLLRAGCWDESHEVSQDISSPEGSYWHGIAHRMEPDDFNAGYWFRQVGGHAIYPALHAETANLLAGSSVNWQLRSSWDPSLFIEWCAQARAKPNSEAETLAIRIQDTEWKLLFHFCIS